MFRSVGSLINLLLRHSKNSQAIIALQVRQAAKDSLGKICADLPLEIIESIKPSSFKGRVLTLIILTPLVSSELQMRSEGLIHEINETLGKKVVLRLKFRTS